MPDRDRDSITVVRQTTWGDGLYVIVGALVVAALIGAYVLLGTPGLHIQVANAPAGQNAGQNIDATVEQPPTTPAPAIPVTAQSPD